MMKTFKNFATAMWQDEGGISSVEYALLLAFVAGGIIIAADQLSVAVSGEMTAAANCLAGGTTVGCGGVAPPPPPALP